MLKYTGHPFLDIGAATIAAFSSRADIESVTESDLDAAADYMTRNYVQQPLKSFLTVVFPNSGFTQPAFEKTPERRLAYAQEVLRAYQPDEPAIDATCVFTGRPAHGRVYRQHIPLLNGEDVINFSPEGEAGLPVSGTALLCIQAFPMGCAKCGGRLLAVHSDNPEITQHFAAEFLRQNLVTIQMVQQSGGTKLPESQQSMRTLLIEKLIEANRQRIQSKKRQQPFSITAYHLSNSGQSPSLDIYPLPSELIEFLNLMLGTRYHNDWKEIVRRAWEIAPVAKNKGETGAPFTPRRNYLYEDLFRLPENAPRFIRTYFLRLALRLAKMDKADPRGSYTTRAETELVSWKITEKFIERILHMESDRINQIKALGEQLARYVHEENDRRFFRSFFTEQHYDVFRNNLLRASMARVKHGKPPLITFDAFVSVFEESDVMARPDWRLARDLTLIKMIETLYELGHAQDALQDLPVETLATTEEQPA